MAVGGKITRSGSKEIYLNFLNHRYIVMAIDVLGRGQTCPLEGQASHDCLVPVMCCLHQVFKADRGSHHICSTTDDLEGKVILGTALLVPTLVLGQLLTCEGGVELKVMALSPWGDTGRVPEGLSGTDPGIH